jgi:hypothetical protein
MRCYFNLSDGEQFLLDDMGVEVSNLDLAQAETLQAIQELSNEADTAGVDWSNWTLNMTDATGKILHTIPIKQAIANENATLQ